MWETTYRCRLCGEHFTGNATSSKDTANDVALSIITGQQFHKGNPVSPIQHHECRHGDAIGFGDIIGIVKRKELQS